MKRRWFLRVLLAMPLMGGVALWRERDAPAIHQDGWLLRADDF